MIVKPSIRPSTIKDPPQKASNLEPFVIFKNHKNAIFEVRNHETVRKMSEKLEPSLPMSAPNIGSQSTSIITQQGMESDVLSNRPRKHYSDIPYWLP